MKWMRKKGFRAVATLFVAAALCLGTTMAYRMADAGSLQGVVSFHTGALRSQLAETSPEGGGGMHPGSQIIKSYHLRNTSTGDIPQLAAMQVSLVYGQACAQPELAGSALHPDDYARLAALVDIGFTGVGGAAQEWAQAADEAAQQQAASGVFSFYYNSPVPMDAATADLGVVFTWRYAQAELSAGDLAFVRSLGGVGVVVCGTAVEYIEHDTVVGSAEMAWQAGLFALAPPAQAAQPVAVQESAPDTTGQPPEGATSVIQSEALPPPADDTQPGGEEADNTDNIDTGDAASLPPASSDPQSTPPEQTDTQQTGAGEQDESTSAA